MNERLVLTQFNNPTSTKNKNENKKYNNHGNQTSNMKTKALMRAIFLPENPIALVTPLLVGLLARRNIALIGLSSLLLCALAELANARSRKADLTSAPHAT